MAASPDSSLVSAVIELRNQGLSDNLVVNELLQQGYSSPEIQQALSQADSGEGSGTYPSFSPGYSQPAAPPAGDENIYERIEEIAEAMIDEKWDELIGEVKKIIEWKEKVEEKQARLQGDIEKLKGDFTLLHQGVLGKLEDYDERMQNVGTELKAVGKVFKDVIPEFVENVKELSATAKVLKKEKR